jgi:hypothetical protein
MMRCTSRLPKKGNFEIIRWAAEERGKEVYLVFAKKGHLEALQWAFKEEGWQGCPELCQALAKKGDLGLLQWAREKGCPWDHNVYLEAGVEGHLELAEWAREEGCPWRPW